MYGTILGNRYEILNKVGEGGMAEVFKARCNKLNRFVAVKVLKPEFADNEEIAEKFQREATAVANLSDTNIVNVLDVGNQDEVNYIVMEYVEGRTLKDVIRSVGKIIPSVAIDVAIQVARGLDCAHRNNIIHRDIKPQNILVNEEGHIKVADFGIAKSVGASTITNTTTIMGSAHYLSPEQAKGGYIDCRTDLYSLGIVIYEMVTGQLPFDGDSAVTIALKHLQDQVVPPKELNPELSDSMNQLIMKAVDKDPNYRYQTAKEMILDLQKVKSDPNAAIYEREEDVGGATTIMAPISPEQLQQNNHLRDLEDEYYDEDGDEDEYYPDEDDDEYEDDDDFYGDEKSKKGGKGPKSSNKGLIIGSIIGLILLLGLGGFTIYKMLGNTEVKKIVVPDIIGMTQEDGKKKLEGEGLVVKVEETKSTKPKGEVTRTSPAKGTEVDKGAEITMYVSNGQKPSGSQLYSLLDYPQEDAKKELIGLGVKEENIIFNNAYDDKIKKGNVCAMDPGVGTEITDDLTVTLTISSGKENEDVEVPELRGAEETTAKSKLKDLGLKCDVQSRETTNSNENGRVVDQSKYPGDRVKKGDTIIIYIGIFKEEKITINIGDYIREGMTYGAAENAAYSSLAGKGVGVSFVGYPYTGAVPPGTDVNNKELYQVVEISDKNLEMKQGEYKTITVTVEYKGPKAEEGEGEGEGEGEQTWP